MTTHERIEFLKRTQRQAEILRTIVGWGGLISIVLAIATCATK